MFARCADHPVGMLYFRLRQGFRLRQRLRRTGRRTGRRACPGRRTIRPPHPGAYRLPNTNCICRPNIPGPSGLLGFSIGSERDGGQAFLVHEVVPGLAVPGEADELGLLEVGARHASPALARHGCHALAGTSVLSESPPEHAFASESMAPSVSPMRLGRGMPRPYVSAVCAPTRRPPQQDRGRSQVPRAAHRP